MKKFIKKHPLIFIAVLYLLLPWDFIPDLLGFIGLSDDILVMLLFSIVNYIVQKKEQANKTKGQEQ
jgi:uncharacterized membrane protein YkvA (DUF1232 family)